MLIIEDGGRVECGSSVLIGEHVPASNNVVMVSGSGSIWEIDRLIVGSESSGNRLMIAEGGAVISDHGCAIGNEGDYNSVLVSGLNSRLDLEGGVRMGFKGSYNSLVVTNGGRVLSSQGQIGGGPWLFDAEPGHNNYAIVRGTNSEWVINTTFDNQSGLLAIGDYGVSNSLYIQDGALVQDQDGRIGFALSATDNHVSVSDGGTWSNSRILSVGYNGSRNSLLVNSGSLAEDQVGYVGYGSGASSNSVVIRGIGSIWQNRVGLYIGGSDEESGGNANWIEVSDGGTVSTESLKIYAGNQFNLNDGGKLAVNTNFNAGMAGFNWNEGGALEVGGELTGAGPVIDGGRSLIMNGPQAEWNEFDGIVGQDDSGNGLVIENGGSVTLSTVALGFSQSSHENYVTVQGSGSTLLCDSGAALSNLSGPPPVPPDDRPEQGSLTFPEYMEILDQNPFFWEGGGLYIGRWGSGNRLEVLDGASVLSHSAALGVRAGSSNNVVYVSGENSLWSNAGNLYMGGILSPHWIDGGMKNALYVTDGGKVTVGENAGNRNYSMISIDPDSLMTVGGNYYQDASSTLHFGVDTNAVGAPVAGLLSVDGTAEFEEGATISYFSDVGQLRFDVIYTNMIVKANALIVGGVTNALTADLAKLNAFGSLVRVNFEEENQDIYALIGRKKVVESAGLTAGTLLANVATEIDRMSLAGNPGADNLVELLNMISGSAQAAQLQQHFAEAAPTPMHSQGLGGGLVEVRQRMRVAGPQGPGGMGQYKEAQDWMEVYGSWAEHNATGSVPGYEHNVYGTVGGMDWVRGDLLMGVGLGYSYSTILQNAGQSRASAGYGVGYLSLNRGDWFVDLALAGGGGRVRDKVSSAFGFEGKYDAGNGSLYFGTGRDIGLFGGGLTFTPEASMQLGYYYQDSHRETSVTGLQRNVSDYDQFSAQSSLGATLALEKEVNGIIWKPELRLRWLHEYETDADPLSYTLVGGLGSKYSATVNSPEEDIFETGLGLSCTLQNDLSLVFDVDWRRGDDYDAYTGSGRIVYRF
ncbi:MAG: autotransporter domain-containing protein [Pontiellaceae bacterium]|nr:autotransporter domain-containing protein [Pontiellaceae bacterium]